MESTMTEKEMLIVYMTESLEVMKQIQTKEEEYSSLSEKLDKYSRILYIVLIVIAGIIVASFASKLGNFVSSALGVATIVSLLVLRSVSVNGIKSKMKKVENEVGQLKSDPTLKWLPLNYRHSLAFNAIYSYIINMRANTLQEAINLYETELHQARVEIYTAMNNRLG